MPNPFGPQYLQQQQRQMEQMRQRQMEGAYWEEQQRAHRDEEERLKHEAERFRQAQRKAEELRRRHAAGKISDAKFRKELQSLALQDASGAWWSVGLKSGEWHRYDEDHWTRATPLVLSPTAPAEPRAFARATPSRQRFEPSHHPFRALFRFVFTLVVFGALGWGAAVMADSARLPIDPGLLFLGGLVLGAVMAVLRAARAYRGD